MPTTSRRHRLRLDRLESRTVPATATFSNGTLAVIGTSVGDTIIVKEQAGRLTVSGTPIQFRGSFVNFVMGPGVTRVFVAGGTGHDVIDVSTVTRKATIIGGPGNDRITGGLGTDDIYGRDGNDTIAGAVGNDSVFGENGDDTLTGDDGNDSIFGGTGNDSLSGLAGNDILYCEAGDDVGHGGDGNDELRGNIGIDQLNGGPGNDLILGENGSDVLHGNEGNDTVVGGADLDQVFGDVGDDLVSGADVPDAAPGSPGEVVDGGGGSDTVVGGSGGDTGGGNTGGTGSGSSTTGTVQQAIRAQWFDGMTNDITVRNTGTGTMNGWKLEFHADFEITEIWNAQIVEHVGNHYTIRNIAGHWAATIRPNTQITFGFNARLDATDATNIHDIELNDQALPPPTGGGTGGGTTPATGTVSQTVRSEWFNGSTHDVTVRNTGTVPINGWTVSFDADFDITEIWNAQIVSRVGTRYTIRSIPNFWNARIIPNSAISFGFNTRLDLMDTTAIRNVSLTANSP